MPEAERIMDRLRITENDELYYFKRIRYTNDTPIAVDRTYVPTASLSEEERAKFAENQAAHVYSIDARNTEPCERDILGCNSCKGRCLLPGRSCRNTCSAHRPHQLCKNSILEYNVRLRLTYRCDYSIAYKGIEPRELSI
ncbi:UTRA domain-containing protein [Extibacter muris]|nr:UTRA domain-containing protein [Extibacter muris]MCU0078436.1 UTRA domain-containing protein [Extibacter muris]